MNSNNSIEEKEILHVDIGINRTKEEILNGDIVDLSPFSYITASEDIFSVLDVVSVETDPIPRDSTMSKVDDPKAMEALKSEFSDEFEREDLKDDDDTSEFDGDTNEIKQKEADELETEEVVSSFSKLKHDFEKPSALPSQSQKNSTIETNVKEEDKWNLGKMLDDIGIRRSIVSKTSKISTDPVQKTSTEPIPSFELKKEIFSRLASLKRLGLGWGSQELQRTNSLDSVVALPHKRGIQPSKSILKNSSSIRDLKQLQVAETNQKQGESGEIEPSADVSEMAISGTTTEQYQQNMILLKHETTRAHLLRMSSGFSSSAPNLHLIGGDLSQINVGEAAGLRKSGSNKQLIFNLENTPVMPVLSKSAYNRKPDNNMTFKKLTPKLKDQIRMELNEFKRNEMKIHQESAHNTVFH